MHFISNKVTFGGIFFFFVLIACNPTKQTRQVAVEKNKQIQETKVKFPAQHVYTPENISYVYDYENLYSPAQQKKLDSLLRVFESTNLIAIKLVTVKSADMQAADFDANNAQLYKEWDLAHGKSGKVMVIGISKEMQKAKADYGPFVAKFLSEADVANIISANRPTMEAGDFFGGTWSGLNQIMDTVRKNIAF